MKNWYLAFFLLSFNVHAQISLEKFNSVFQEKPKPILLYFSTSWCSYCMIQKKQIEKDKSLLHILNENIYYLELNAESTEKIMFLNQQYHFDSKKKRNSFLEEFVSSEELVSYPYWVLLSKDLKIEMTYSGLIKNKPLKLLLEKYFQKP